MRAILVRLHRYLGLATALFLALAGLTGSVLAFHHELDEWLNPGFYHTSGVGEVLPPERLVARVEQAYPRMQVWYMEFPQEPGHAALLALVLMKIVATGLTISSGGSGGVFGPSVFIGGVLGGAVGQFLVAIFPGWGINPAAFALVGMAGFFAGVSKTPITSILMVCEMTGNYSLLVPLMLVCGLHMGLSTRWTLYEEQVPSPIDSAAHQGDFVIDVLEQIKVEVSANRRRAG